MRAVASICSWRGGGGEGGVGQKFPNDENNFRIYHAHGMRSHERACYPENGRNFKQTQFNLGSLKCHFLDFGGSFDRILMIRKQRFSMLKFTICIQFSSTKWAKAYLINYILEKLQENMGNMILCSLLMDNVAA